MRYLTPFLRALPAATAPTRRLNPSPAIALLRHRCLCPNARALPFSTTQAHAAQKASPNPREAHTQAQAQAQVPEPARTAGDVQRDALSEESTSISYTLPHPIWPNEFVDAVQITHVPPASFQDRLAYNTVQLMRFNFDWMSGYSWRKLNAESWYNRIIFLETVAGVPGSVAATLRHMRSLRRMERDHGWIHTLLEEAENERMHLMTAIALRRPGKAFRSLVWVTQGIFFNFFFVSYVVSPRFAHRIVGYLEEEAVKTYTHLLSEIDKGNVPEFASTKVPPIACAYWKLKPEATLRDLFATIRADEAHHREVNHSFASMKPDEPNPFPPGY